MLRRGVGSLRRGQVVASFGPGSTIDLPDISVIVGGLDWWRGEKKQVVEPRLAEKAAKVLGVPFIRLFEPPLGENRPGAPLAGIGVEEFPLWFVGDYEVKRGNVRSRPLVHRNQLLNGKLEFDRKKYEVTPVRFVMACPNGHIDDIEWYVFTHAGQTPCRRMLWLDELGSSGDLTDQLVRCDCGQSRALAQAVRRDVLGACRGPRPWLTRGEKCGGENGTPQMMRLLIRTASNAYYPQKLSVVSIPDTGDEVRTAVRRHWTTLEAVDTVEKVEQLRALIPIVASDFIGVDATTILRFIVAQREGRVPDRREIKLDEFDALTQTADTLGDDRPEGDFYARTVPRPQQSPFRDEIERVVVVHRLREVSAQVGFTRFEPVVPDMLGELDLQVKRADLAAEPSWLPAVETRGEGVFIKVRDDAINTWRARAEVRERANAFRTRLDPSINRGASVEVYVLLHSLSHLLITAVALDCGYNTSAIRERIYVTPSGCGILLFTGTSDAEGTLGGLAQVANRIDRYLEMALELGRLCANDPVCAQHSPDEVLEERDHAGAACHGCLLVAETCCERHNEFLDRSLVVSTVEGLGCEFFRD